MPETTATLERLLAERARSQARAAELLASAPELPEAKDLTADHPLARALGLERARRALGPSPLQARQLRAAERRAKVAELSRAGRPVREIAGATGLAYWSVVEVRVSLRREGAID